MENFINTYPETTEKMVFKLYATCIPVRGARRSIIYDLQRGGFQFIPNILYEILSEHADKSVPEIKSFFKNNFDEYIDSYFEHLIKIDYGFWCDEPEAFPPLELTWEHPSLITNAILDISKTSKHDYESISQELDAVGCKALNIRSYDTMLLEQLACLLACFENSRLRSIDLVLKFEPSITLAELHKLGRLYPRLASMLVHSAPKDKQENKLATEVPITYSSHTINDHSFCGVIDPSYFITNVSMFTESKHFNNCLNKKVGIDWEGNIKNCPSLLKEFGRIGTNRLIDIVKTSEFAKPWTISKDQIDVCRDCEFRYMCIDCRAFNQNHKTAKPVKCTYNPYLAAWDSQ